MKNYQARSFGAGLRIAAVTGLSWFTGLGAYAQATTPAANPPEDEVKMEAFSVTGSRIKRIDAETPQPVVRISEADFKATGFSTVGDAIRAMPAVSGQSLVAIDGGTSFTPGVSSFNLRGLGNNNTLVLINGRRAAPFATAGFNGFQTVFDFNSIPVAAVDSIEVLKDGASAIYGSDAVAGVVNVNLKRNYTGLTTELSYGNTLTTDSNERSAFMIFGAQAGKVSLVTTFDFQQRASIYGRDLDYTDEADGRPYGGINQESSAGPVGAVRGLAGLPQFPNGTAFFANPTANPTLAGATAGIPLYNFQQEAGFTPDTRSYGFYTRATYDFSDTLTGFFEGSFRRSEVYIDAAPAPLFIIQENGNSVFGTVNFPASNPFNPFGQDIIDLRWRLSQLGNRIQDSTADSPRMVAGLEGTLPFGDWTWNAALLYSKNTVTTLARNNAGDNLIQQAFDGVVINGVTKWLNPFGPNDQDILDFVKFTNPNHDTFEVRGADISASGSIFTLPAGDVGLALGAEVRTEKMENIGTQLNRDGLIVGGSTGTDVVGDRRLYSYYAEVSVPVFKEDSIGSLELQAAVRHEDYSDFGQTTKPKFAAVYRPIPELLLRASYGESFLAPNLAFLYSLGSTSFTAQALPDPLRPQDPAAQIQQIGAGNPNLQPEETEVVYGGVVLQPFARQTGSIFRELSFGVDYYKFDQTNLITRPTAQLILSNLPVYGNLIVRNAPAAGQTVGTISHVITNWINLTTGVYEGYDMNIRWVLPRSESLGQFRVDLSGTYIDHFEGTNVGGALVDTDGNLSFPLFRGSATLAWSKGDWASSIFVNYIGDYSTLGSGLSTPDVDKQWIVSPQVSYRGWYDSTITVGVRNVFDQEPPVDPSDSKLVNENLNHVEPMFVYVRWSKDW